MLTIEQYAWRIAGPRDFVANLVINTLVPWWVFREYDLVPLFVSGDEQESAARIFVPMMAVMTGLTSFGAHAAGIVQRRRGKISPPWIAGSPWFTSAARCGLTRGLFAMTVALALAYLVKQFDPDARVSYWTANLGLGLSSAVVAYFMHASAMVRSGMLGR